MGLLNAWLSRINVAQIKKPLLVKMMNKPVSAMTTFKMPMAGVVKFVVISLTISRDLESLMFIEMWVSRDSIVKGIQHEVQ